MHFWVKLNQQRSFRLVYNPHQLVRYNPHSSAQHWTSHLRGVIQSSLPCLAAETKPTELLDELVACAPGHWLSYPQTSHGNGKSTINVHFNGEAYENIWTYMKISCTLSGWWFQPLWKIWKSVGVIKFPIYRKKIMFQTTNQLVIGGLSICHLWVAKAYLGRKHHSADSSGKSSIQIGHRVVPCNLHQFTLPFNAEHIEIGFKKIGW